MRLIQYILVVFALLSGAANATPPRVTVSDDRIVAATQTHLYVMRDISDNTGSHYFELLDQHLIEIDIETGEATQYWPLRRMAVTNLDEAGDFRVPGAVEERPGETHNMMVELRELGAAPLTPGPWAVEDLELENGALMQGVTQLLTPFGIRKAGRAQLAILRDAYPPNLTPEGWPSDDQIAFYDLYADGDWDCAIQPEGQTLFRAQNRVTVAKLRCEDADLNGIWSFHIIVKGEL